MNPSPPRGDKAVPSGSPGLRGDQLPTASSQTCPFPQHPSAEKAEASLIFQESRRRHVLLCVCPLPGPGLLSYPGGGAAGRPELSAISLQIAEMTRP